jgi:hypothetical protein
MSSPEYSQADVAHFDSRNAEAARNIYQALPPGQLRVITVQAYSEHNITSELNCHLEVISLTSESSYRALSYVWGNKSSPGHIRLDGHSYLVTQSLHGALQRLRQSDAGTKLWIDALRKLHLFYFGSSV